MKESVCFCSSNIRNIDLENIFGPTQDRVARTEAGAGNCVGYSNKQKYSASNEIDGAQARKMG